MRKIGEIFVPQIKIRGNLLLLCIFCHSGPKAVFEISGCTGARCTQTFSLCTQLFDLGARRAPKKNGVVQFICFFFHRNHERRTCFFSFLSTIITEYTNT